MKNKNLFLVILLWLNVAMVMAQTFTNLQLTPTSPEKVKKASATDAPTLYGTVIANMEEDESQYGLYSISAAKNSKLTKVADVPLEVQANAGGIYLDGVYRFIHYDIWTETTTYYEYDTQTWKCLKKEVLPDKTNIGIDEAYDPTTGNTYGCFTDATGSSYVFGYVDHDTHTRTYISTPTVLFFAVAVSPEGVVYAIGSDGVLYQVDKETGKQTRIGETGISPKYYQSAVFDMNTGKMYWAACNKSGNSGLYEVDTTTGKATLLNAFSSRQQVTGLYIPFERAKAEAPAEVGDLQSSFETSSLSGSISFQMPSTSYNGAELSGDISYTVILNGNDFATATASPGENITLDITGVAGNNTISVYAQNAAGRGPISKLQRWLGYDGPVMTKPLLTFDGEKTVTLTWDKPTESVHGGYLDETAIKYKVTRYPGALTIATNYAKNTLTQKLSPKQYTKYYYEVSAISQGQEGTAENSNQVGIGEAFTIPFTEDFSGSYTDYFTQTDEWLITPALNLSSEYIYNVSFEAAKAGDTDAAVEVYLGNDCTPEAMTQLLSTEELSSDAKTVNAFAHCKESGRWFIGIRTIGSATIGNLDIEEGSSADTPDSVTNLTATCNQGENAVTISFKAPEKTVSGKDLTDITDIKIYHGTTILKSITDVEPGQECTYVDEKAVDGMQTYEVRVANSVGTGVPAQVSVFVGTDTPTAPVNVKLVDQRGTPHLTWDAPTEGANGQYLNPDKITYKILRNDNQIVASGLKTTSFDDTSLDLTSGKQAFAQYAVYAVTAAGTSEYCLSNAIVAGQPYDLPFHELFPANTLTYSFWATEGSNASWALSTSRSSNGDGGSAVFSPSKADGWAKLYTGKIQLGLVNDFRVTYNYFATPGSDTKLLVELRHQDLSIEVIDSIDMKTLTGESGWRKASARVRGEFPDDYVHIMFHAISGDGETSTYVDDVTVSETLDNDLATTISGPEHFTAGSTGVITATVSNIGGETFSGDYSVRFFADGKLFEEIKGEALAAGESHGYEFEYPVTVFDSGQHTFSAAVEAEDDEDTENNASDKLTISVKKSTLPTVTDLSVEENAPEAKVSWNAPLLEGEKVVNDDVENYEAFAIENVGDWTMVDVDGGLTYGIASGSSYVAFPNAIAAKSFIVFNAPESGAVIYDNGGRPTGWLPRSGDQMFISFQDADGATDDWMISPELPGTEQTINFYVKSINPSSHGYETFEVLYSTTDKELASFTQITNIIGEAPADWTEVRAELPEGTKYFAIRGTSAGHFALLVDDISYSAGNLSDLHLQGYNIFADQKQLNAEPVSNTDYTITDATGMKDVEVTAVYDEGQSAAVEVSLTTGISRVLQGGATVSRTALGISLSNLAGRHYAVYNVGGMLIEQGEGKCQSIVKVKSGTYIIRIDNRTWKITI